MIMFEERGTCPCGHEVIADTGECIVWDERGDPHTVADNRGECSCCGRSIHDLEARWPYAR